MDSRSNNYCLSGTREGDTDRHRQTDTDRHRQTDTDREIMADGVTFSRVQMKTSQAFSLSQTW